MEILSWLAAQSLVLVDYLLHLDRYLKVIIETYGAWTYAILFVIVFCETGLVVTPFLPGDSLLFAAGAFAGLGSLDPWLAALALFAAAVLGDTVNYGIGHVIGPRVFERPDSRIFRREYLARTQSFFDRYGGKTIVIARFVPIVRTFAPFLAGVGTMHYGRFIAYNLAGALLWVGLLVGGGFFFGTRPIVQANFTLVILMIIVISVLPGIYEFWRERRRLAAAEPPHRP